MPEPIEVRKVAIESVTDASGLARLIDDGVIEARPGARGDRQDRGQRRGERLHPHPGRPGLPRGARWPRGTRSAEEWRRSRWSGRAAPTACSARTPRSSPPRPTPRRATSRGVSVGVAMSDVILPEDIGRPAMVEKVAAGRPRGDEARRHRRPGRRPLRADQDAAAHPGHHQRRQVARPGRGHRGHRPVDGHLQLHHRARHRRRARRDRDARAPTRSTATCRCTPRVASCSSGVELDRAQIVVVGNVRGIGGRYRDRPLRHEGRAGRRRHLGGDPLQRHRPARAPAPDATSATGWSTSS